MHHFIAKTLLLFSLIGFYTTVNAQRNLLLNGDFEDINTCSEYKSECGVEAWFYLRDVKAQMLSNDNQLPNLGNNSFAVFYPWNGYKDFSPVLGTLLPCALKKGTRYTFSGMVSAKIDNRLTLMPGVSIDDKYFVPLRPFTKTLRADTITSVQPIKESNFFRFEYSFEATGRERYLTFGTFIREDTVGAKRALIGNQVVSITLDNFELVSADPNEIACADFMRNKNSVYHFDSRHKEMDNQLYAKGEIPVRISTTDSGFITRQYVAPPPPITDTLNLGDVFFDFNKADLKPSSRQLLSDYFRSSPNTIIDSIYIDGHTDSVGSEAKNLLLSEQRCHSVKTFLTDNKLVSAAIIIRPFGKSKPIATNTTAAGRALNRRVQLITFSHK